MAGLLATNKSTTAVSAAQDGANGQNGILLHSLYQATRNADRILAQTLQQLKAPYRTIMPLSFRVL